MSSPDPAILTLLEQVVPGRWLEVRFSGEDDNERLMVTIRGLEADKVIELSLHVSLVLGGVHNNADWDWRDEDRRTQIFRAGPNWHQGRFEHLLPWIKSLKLR